MWRDRKNGVSTDGTCGDGCVAGEESPVNERILGIWA